MTEKKYKMQAMCMAFALVFAVGYGIGYAKVCKRVLETAKGCKRVLETAKGWQEMYDRHINGQWEMIQRRDTLYVKALRLKLNYTDGHSLTPED